MQQLLLGRQLALALRRDLADQDVAGLDASADAHDAALVEVAQRLLGDVRDVARELLAPELGLADLDLELVDVDRRVDVVLDEVRAEQDRVFVVVAVPRHERDRHVLAEGEHAVLRCRAVGDHFARLDLLAELDDRRLVLARALVQRFVLPQLVLVVTDDDARRVDRGHAAALARPNDHARVARDDFLHARHHHRRVGRQQRHCLPLHVGAHQRAVGVVVLKERDQRCRDADDLLGRDVHVLDVLAIDERRVTLDARDDASLIVADELAGLVDLGVRGREHRVVLLVGAQPHDFVGDLAVLDDDVRRGQEAVVVERAVDREARDQADVRAFRRLDRAQAPVVRDVHVAHFEAGALAIEAARAEGRQPALVRELRQRVGLVDDLAELAAREEVLDGGRERLAVDQIARRDRVDVLEVHPLLRGAPELQEALAELVARELLDRAHAAVAQVVDVVDFALAAAQPEDVADRLHEVRRHQGLLRFRRRRAELAVQAETADATEAVARLVEELLVEQLLRLLDLRRVAGAQALVDLEQRLFVAVGRVLAQRVEDQEVLGLTQHLDVAQFAGRDRARRFFGDLLAAAHEWIATRGIDDVADRVRADQRLGELGLRVRLLPRDLLHLVELAQDRGVRRVLRVHRAQQRRARELARLVDADRDGVLLGDVQLDPRATLRDDPARVQPLLARVQLDREVDAGRTMQLADRDALAAVDDELAAADHDRDLAEVDLLLDRLGLDQADPDLERVAVGHAQLATLLDRVPRAAEFITDVLETQGLVVRVDREHLAQQGLEPLHLAPVGRDLGLQEAEVRLRLHLDEVGDLGDGPVPAVDYGLHAIPPEHPGEG